MIRGGALVISGGALEVICGCACLNWGDPCATFRGACVI